MSNDKSRNSLALLRHLIFHRVNGFLHLSLVSFVKSACSLIENQHFWLFDECTSKCKSLLLATRELASAGTNMSIDALFVSHHKIIGVGSLESFLNLLVSSVGLTHKEVLFDCCIEKNGLLTDVADLLSIVSQVN